MKCTLRGHLGGGGRFIIKLLMFTVFCCTSLLLFYELRSETSKLTFYMNPPPPTQLNLLVRRNPLKLVQHLGEPHVDKSPSLTEEFLIEDIQEHMPNLPITYWNKNKKKVLRINSTCASFPNLFNIEFNNAYWQTLYTLNGTFQLFGAYLDVRKNSLLGPTVRILGMLDRIQPTVKTHCQFWFEDSKKPVIVQTVEYRYVWYRQWGNFRQGIYQPYLIACKIPKENWNEDNPPVAVSLVEKPCDNAANALKVIYNKPEGEKKDFAVCVKGLDFPHLDLSVKLAEWIELLNLLGADKIFLYDLEVHPNVSKLLRHYEKEGKVQVTPLKLAGGQPNAPSLQHFFLTKKIIHKRQNELIPYNDCFYKHMYEYKYIVLLDTDEVIMPVQGNSWKELMDSVLIKAEKAKKIERASFNVRNVYFLDDLLHDHGWFKDIPNYMHMLQHVYRTKNFTKPGFYVKSFFNTEKTLILHNHYPLGCLGTCFSFAIDTVDAQLQHYRRDCVNELKKSCANFRNNSVMDTTVWKYKETLIERVNTALKALGYFSREQEFLDER